MLAADYTVAGSAGTWTGSQGKVFFEQLALIPAGLFKGFLR